MDKTQKRENFKRLYPKRLSNLKESFRILRKLSDKNFYEYSQKDIQKIFNEIDEEVEDFKNSFLNGHSGKNFKL